MQCRPWGQWEDRGEGCRHVCAGSKNGKLLKTKINNVNCKDVKEDKHQSVGDSFQISAV